MASPTIGTGKGGKSFKTGSLRPMSETTLSKKIHAIVRGNKKVIEGLGDYQKAMLLKLAPTLLPRLNEHTGETGSQSSTTSAAS